MTVIGPGEKKEGGTRLEVVVREDLGFTGHVYFFKKQKSERKKCDKKKEATSPFTEPLLLLSALPIQD